MCRHPRPIRVAGRRLGAVEGTFFRLVDTLLRQVSLSAAAVVLPARRAQAALALMPHGDRPIIANVELRHRQELATTGTQLFIYHDATPFTGDWPLGEIRAGSVDTLKQPWDCPHTAGAYVLGRR
jgi:hypothetical protein